MKCKNCFGWFRFCKYVFEGGEIYLWSIYYLWPIYYLWLIYYTCLSLDMFVYQSIVYYTPDLPTYRKEPVSVEGKLFIQMKGFKFFSVKCTALLTSISAFPNLSISQARTKPSSKDFRVYKGLVAIWDSCQCTNVRIRVVCMSVSMHACICVCVGVPDELCGTGWYVIIGIPSLNGL